MVLNQKIAFDKYYQENKNNMDDDTIDRSINEFADTKEIGKGKLIQPLRFALSGTLTGPSMVQLMMILGKDTCLRRIKNILSSIQK